MSPQMKLFFTLVSCLLLAAALPAQVMINEVLYDNQGTDDPAILYTEIFGPPGTSLDGWRIVNFNGNGGAVHATVQLEGEIPADGYFVVGGANVENVDLISPHDFQNAGSVDGVSCDGIDLYNAEDDIVDHICYGECDADDVCDGEGGSNAPDPFPSQGINSAIARIPDHQDTDNNGDDFAATEDLTPGAPNEGEPCVPIEAELADLRENDNDGVPVMYDDFVIVEGVVTIDNMLLQEFSSFFIQDDNAGVNVFGGNPPEGIVEGDLVRVSAWVELHNGLTELDAGGPGNCIWAVQVLDHVATPEPAVITGGSFFEAFEGMLVQINNVSIVGGDAWPTEGNDATIQITDEDGPIDLRIESGTDVDGTDEPEGVFNVIGIIGQWDFDSPYDEFYQITPRYSTDIIPAAVGENPALGTPAEFKLDGAFPNPFNSTTNLNFTVGSARDLTVRVFDLLGREVASERLTGLTPGAHVWNWSPTSATGLYIVRLESANLSETAKLLYLK